MKLLMDYDWEGNIRELENAVERALIMEDGDTLLPRCFPWLIEKRQTKYSADSNKIYSLEELERKHLQRVLEETGYRKGEAANLLGIDRKTLYKKIKKYALEQKKES
jgi:DNA-binding NtrC family response regulator